MLRKQWRFLLGFLGLLLLRLRCPYGELRHIAALWLPGNRLLNCRRLPGKLRAVAVLLRCFLRGDCRLLLGLCCGHLSGLRLLRRGGCLLPDRLLGLRCLERLHRLNLARVLGILWLCRLPGLRLLYCLRLLRLCLSYHGCLHRFDCRLGKLGHFTALVAHLLRLHRLLRRE